MAKLFDNTLDNIQMIHEELVNFFDIEVEKTEELNAFLELLNHSDLINNSTDMYLFLQSLGTIFNFHYEPLSQFSYIKKIIQNLSDRIKTLLNQDQLFYIALKSKLYLMILLETNVLDKYRFIQNLIHLEPKSELLLYLTPEVNEYIESQRDNFDPIVKQHLLCPDISDDEDEQINSFERLNISIDEYIELREKGENTSKFCLEIRENNFNDFDIKMQKGMEINMKLNNQLYDSCEYPLKEDKMPNLFEYSAYKGSIEICKFLSLHEAKLEDQCWFYTIHGRNADLIHLIEELKIECDYQKAFRYAIKCHNNAIADYIFNQYLDNNSIIPGIIEAIKSYNFSYLKILIPQLDKDEKKDDLSIINELIRCGYCNTINHIISLNHNQIDLKECMSLAIKENNSGMVNTLLSHNLYAQIIPDNYNDWIYIAITSDYFDALKILLGNEMIQKLISKILFLVQFMILIFNIFNLNSFF